MVSSDPGIDWDYFCASHPDPPPESGNNDELVEEIYMDKQKMQEEEQAFVGRWGLLLSEAKSPRGGLRLAGELIASKPKRIRAGMLKRIQEVADQLNPDINWKR